MAYTAVKDMTELLVTLITVCLANLPDHHVHPLFRKVLFSDEFITELLSSAGLIYAPGLLETIKAATPPTIAWFKALPSDFRKRWAVYALVLEKLGCRPKIYFGSGTNALEGVSARLSSYRNAWKLPRHVQIAIKNGYTITHTGVLVWMPIPDAVSKPKLRVLFVRIEAALAFVFWAMRSGDKGYQIADDIVPWDLDTMPYDGLCSHSAFNEMVVGEHDLTEDELRAVAAELKQRRVAQQATISHRSHEKHRGTTQHRVRKATNQRAYVLRNPEKAKQVMESANATYKKKALESKKYYDPVCDKAFKTRQHLNLHLATDKHKTAAAEAASAASSSS